MKNIKKGSLVRIKHKDIAFGVRTKNYIYSGRSNKLKQIYLIEGHGEIYMNHEDIISIEDLS